MGYTSERINREKKVADNGIVKDGISKELIAMLDDPSVSSVEITYSTAPNTTWYHYDHTFKIIHKNGHHSPSLHANGFSTSSSGRAEVKSDRILASELAAWPQRKSWYTVSLHIYRDWPKTEAADEEVEPPSEFGR